MKRSSSPENDDGPAQKRLTDRDRQMLEEWKQSHEQVDTSGTVIWSGTVKIPDSQKIGFDCSIKTLPQNEGIKSLLPLKQFTMHILPLSVLLSLRPYVVQARRLNLCINENTDMMSYSAFSQAIRHDMRGCAVLKNTTSALHLLCVASFSYEHEDYILGFIGTYQANDTVLGILRSHSLLPCVNPEHNKLVKQNAVLKEELQDKDKMLIEQQRLNQEQVEMHKKMAEKEEELVRLHHEVKEQKKLAEKKQEELATSQNERDMMKKAIYEKDVEIIDETLKRKDREVLSLQDKILELQNDKEQYEALKKEKTELEEELKCRVQMLHEEQNLHQEQKELVEKKEGEIVSLQGKMEKQTKLNEEEKKKLTEMKKEMEEMSAHIMEKDNALREKGNALLRERGKLKNKDKALKQQQHEYKVLEKEKTELEEELKRSVQMLHEEQNLHQEQKELVEKKEGEIVSLQGDMEEKIKLVEEQKKKLTEMEKKMKEMNTQIMEKDNALDVKDTKIMTLQQNQHKVEEMLEGALRMVRHSDAGRGGLHNINQSNNIEADTEQILMMETSRLELQNEVTMKEAALDEIGNMMENEFRCSICSELFIKTVTLNCSHSFCAFCIQKWQKDKRTCPNCRNIIIASVRSVVLDSLIEKIIDKCGDEAKQRRNETVKERERDMQQEGQLCSIPTYVRHSDDETSTASSPASSLAHLSPSAPFMSPCNPPGTSYSMYPPYSYSPSQN